MILESLYVCVSACVCLKERWRELKKWEEQKGEREGEKVVWTQVHDLSLCFLFSLLI